MIVARIRLALPFFAVLAMSAARLWPIGAEQPVQAQEMPTAVYVMVVATPTEQAALVRAEQPTPEPAIVIEQAPVVEAEPPPAWVAPIEEQPIVVDVPAPNPHADLTIGGDILPVAQDHFASPRSGIGGGGPGRAPEHQQGP